MNAATISKKSLLVIWALLMFLLLLTWGLAQFNLRHLNLLAAITIALAKMALVILFFMQVKYQPRTTWIFVAAGFIWLLIMIDLTMSDYSTRGNVPRVSAPPALHESPKDQAAAIPPTEAPQARLSPFIP